MDGILVSDYTVEPTHTFTREYVDYICQLCDNRSRTLKEKNNNYSYARMKYCFDNGRFAHGFYVIKEGDTIVATLGLDNFKGWGVITRYLRHDNDTMVRGMLGLFIYFISQNLNANITGLCSTQNIDQRDLMAVKARLLNKRMERYPSNNTIFHATADVMQNCKKLDYNVNYRNTIQEVYTYYTNKIPPFERAYKAP